ncbi:MAG TPA: SDR family oxidoreductase [Deinococcales bacterium]|nr:SDR family oxidoreductase [Deinococcales bacterium]
MNPAGGLLAGKAAVVYGAGGSVGGAVARAFAAEGARVYLAGRTLDKLEAVAADIRAGGGEAEPGVADALDPASVEAHLDGLQDRAGRLDVTFNAVWIRGDLQGRPLVEMPVEDFTTPVLVGARTHFITATAAARRMLPQGSGVILTLSTSAAALSGRDRRYHRTGGFAAACAAIETFTLGLAAELGPRGIRVLALRSEALPETWGENGADPTFGPRVHMSGGTVLDRLPTLRELGITAAWLASDQASLMSGIVANATLGSTNG